MYNYYDRKDDRDKYNEKDDTTINIHGYDSCSCPRCGSTDIDRDRKYCYACGNRW